MPDIFPAETDLAFAWSVAGDPKFDRSLRGTAAWAFGTGGTPRREITVVPGSLTWTWSVDGSSDELERQELLVGTGIKLSVYDLSAPTERVAIVRYSSVEFEDGLSGVYAGRAEVPIEWFDPAWLERDMLWRIDVEGVERYAFITQDSRDFRVSKDGKRVEFTGLSTGEILKWATVAPANFGTGNQSVTRRFTAPRAAILYTLYGEAQARGAIPMVVADSWNAVQGSDGVPWTTIPELEFNAGGTLYDKLDEWSDLDFEWHMDSQFRWRVATSLGRDLSALVRLYPAQSIEEQVISRSFKELRTSLFVQDGNDGVSLIDDEDAVEEFGVREQYVVFGDTVSEGDRTQNGYALLNLLKNPVVERIVEIDPYAPGRRPFVDFGLGDTVTVMFGTDPFPFRVLAISMRATPGERPRCEVVLEDMIEAARRRRQRLLNAAGGGGGVSTGQSTIFAETNSPVTVSTLSSDICQLTLTSFLSTYGKVGCLLTGTASAPLTLRIELVYGSTVLKTFHHQIARAGLDTAEITWLWTSIPSDQTSLLLRVRTDTGTFAMAAAGDGQLWVEAKGIQGAINLSPDIVVNDDAPGGITDLLTVTETVEHSDLATDEEPTAGELVTDSPYTVVDAVGPSGSGEVWLGVVADSIATEDGSTSSSGSFSSTGTEVTVGNVAGVIHGSWFRFDFPSGVDLTGVTVMDAFVRLTANTTGVTPVRMRLTAADAPDPAVPSNRTDFLTRARTTEYTTWETATVAGTAYRSPTMAPVIQELVDSYGDLESVLIFVEDDSSLLNGNARWRPKDNLLNTPPQLTIYFTPA